MTLPVLEDMADEEYHSAQSSTNRIVDHDHWVVGVDRSGDDEDRESFLKGIVGEDEESDGSARRIDVYRDDNRPR